jgi:hypothetical protein
VAGYAYVLLAVFETIHFQLPAWKDSIFAVLAYGFDEETQERLRKADTSKESSGNTKSMLVRFEQGGGFPSLKGRVMGRDVKGIAR